MTGATELPTVISQRRVTMRGWRFGSASAEPLRTGTVERVRVADDERVAMRGVAPGAGYIVVRCGSRQQPGCPTVAGTAVGATRGASGRLGSLAGPDRPFVARSEASASEQS